VAADERQPGWQLPCAVNNLMLRTTYIGHDGHSRDVLFKTVEKLNVLPDRRSQYHKVGFCHHARVVCGHVDRVIDHCSFEYSFIVNTDDQTLRPNFPHRKRNRSPDKSKAYDGNFVEYCRGGVPRARLNHR
jgi:hypothetical protein